MGKLFDIQKSIIENMQANTTSGQVNLDSYSLNQYTFPSDGYVHVALNEYANSEAYAIIRDANGVAIGVVGGLSNGAYTTWTTFVKKGMKTNVTQVRNNGHVYFSPVGGA